MYDVVALLIYEISSEWNYVHFIYLLWWAFLGWKFERGQGLGMICCTKIYDIIFQRRTIYIHCILNYIHSCLLFVLVFPCPLSPGQRTPSTWHMKCMQILHKMQLNEWLINAEKIMRKIIIGRIIHSLVNAFI